MTKMSFRYNVKNNFLFLYTKKKKVKEKVKVDVFS